MAKWHLGINWEQNSTAALFRDSKPIGCVSEERFTRRKNDEQYPINSINYLLSSNSIDGDDLEAVCFVSTLWSPGYILTRHYTNFSIKDYILEQKKIWYPRLYENDKHVNIIDIFPEKLDINQFPGEAYWKLKLEELPGDSLHVSSERAEETGKRIRREVVVNHLGIAENKIVFLDHSRSHACYAYYATRNPQCVNPTLALTLDAFGDNINYSARIFHREKDSPQSKKIVDDVISCGNSFIVGRLYRYVTLILGLKPNEHEYKVMGMAPYSKRENFAEVLDVFRQFQYVDGLNFVDGTRPQDMYFAVKDLLDGFRFDAIAGGLQAYTEELITSWVSNCVKESKVSKLCLAGGVAMNVKTNKLVSELEVVDDLQIPPSPDDSSQAMGAVYAFLHQEQDNAHRPQQIIFPIASPYLGPKPSEIEDIQILLENIDDSRFEIFTKNIDELVVDMLCSQMVVGRISGHEEFGARALGNRSILADPRHDSIKKMINEKIKNRDFWMPFSCTILEDYALKVLNKPLDNERYAYMTLCSSATAEGVASLSAGLHPYDETCRPQILCKDVNPSYESLILEFGKKTGVYALLNTSLNLHGKPIASNLSDALEVLVKSDLDALMYEKILIQKLT